MEIELKEKFLSRSEVAEGDGLVVTLLGITLEKAKSKKGMEYEVYILRVQDKFEDILKVSCFSSELSSCVRKWGKNADAWINKEIMCMNIPTTTGRSKWRIEPCIPIVVERVN